MSRWAIYIDVQGTSKIYEGHAPRFHEGLDQLFSAVCRIGCKVFPDSSRRLFAHQVGGDGLLIVSNADEGTPDRFIALAVVLMQVLLMSKLVGKAGISAGTYGDIRGCMPCLRELPRIDDYAYSMGAGHLTTLNVMGTALIKAHDFAEQAPRGSRLAVDPALLVRRPPEVIFSDFGGPAIVDWIHTKTATTEHIVKTAGLKVPPASELRKMLIAYVASAGPLGRSDWGRNTLSLNHCSTSEP